MIKFALNCIRAYTAIQFAIDNYYIYLLFVKNLTMHFMFYKL